jgi:hypothetical protein
MRSLLDSRTQTFRVHRLFPARWPAPPSAAPSGSLGIGKGSFDLPAIILLAVRLHPAGLGRLEDAAIGSGAVLTAASHQKERRDRKAAPFYFF